jgi:hypothetical protein
MTIRPIKFLVDTTGYELTWASGLPLDADRTASEYYKGYGNFTCEVKKDGFTVDIYCDGEMRYTNSERTVIIVDGDDLVAGGYDTDKKFADAIESEELQHIMNPWFDLYVRGEHIDSITHDINEALQSAMAWLDEEIANAKEIENFGVSLLDLPA